MIITGIDLRLDEPPFRRAATLFRTLFMGFGGLFFIAGPITFSLEERAWAESVRARFGPGHGPTDAGLPWVVIAVFSTIGLLTVAYSVILTLRIFRTAAWLDGTTAHVRGALRTRSVDLSRAYISMGATTSEAHVGRIGTGSATVTHIAVWEAPNLQAHDPATGDKLTIPLHQPGRAFLPPYALRALADAMVQNRGWDGNDRDVHHLAQRLRILADRNSFTPGGTASATPAHVPLAEPPAASDPWSANAPVPSNPWPPTVSPQAFPDPPTGTGMPSPARRQSNTGLLIAVAALAVLLAGGLSAAGLLYLGQLGRSNQDDASTGASSSGNGADPATAPGTESPGSGQPAESAPLVSGKAILATVGENQVRIKIDKIKSHSAACGPVGLPPQKATTSPPGSPTRSSKAR